MLTGAKDFLEEPFEVAELLVKIRMLLETRALYKHLERHNRALRDKIGERTRDLADAEIEIFHKLAIAAEYRDEGTGEHTKRVGLLSAMLAEKTGSSAEQPIS